jgi:DNA gyrase subunit A
MEVVADDELMIMTKGGIAIRTKVSEIRVTGRIAQGVRLVALDDQDTVSAVARVIPEDKDATEVAEAEADAVAPDGAVSDAVVQDAGSQDDTEGDGGTNTVVAD